MAYRSRLRDRRSYLVSEPHQDQDGAGVKEWIEKLKTLIGQASGIASSAKTAYVSDLANTIRNMLPDADENARPGFAGEAHALLKNKDGKTVIANWAGPGTRVLQRIRRKDPARSKVDEIAKVHDLEYALSGADPEKVREADTHMITSLKKAKAKKSDTPWNINAGIALMTAKNLGEDLNLLKKGSFAGKSVLSIDDRRLLEEELKKEEQKGNGMKKGGVKERLVRAAQSGEGSRQAGKGLRRAGATGKGVGQAGRGVRQSGEGFFDLKTMIPLARQYMTKKNPAFGAKFDKIINHPDVKRGLQMITGSGKVSPDARKLLEKELFMGSGDLEKKFLRFAKDYSKWIQRGSGYDKEMHKGCKALISGSGFWGDLWKGFKYGFNQTKNLLAKVGKYIPVIGTEVESLAKQVPDIPGAAKSFQELKDTTGDRSGRAPAKLVKDINDMIANAKKMGQVKGKGRKLAIC